MMIINKDLMIKSITLCDKSYLKSAHHDQYEYHEVHSRRPWYKPWKWINECALMKYGDDFVDICIRGTVGLGSWIDNFDAYPITPNGVYDGYNDGYKVLKSKIFSAIASPFVNRDAMIRIHGHSRGGPIALQLAYDLYNMGIKIANVLIWDSPKSGTDEWKKNYNMTNLRNITCFIGMKNSIVAKFPPKWLFRKKFVHVPESMIILDNNKNGLLDSVKNHHPKEILKTVLNWNSL